MKTIKTKGKLTGLLLLCALCFQNCSNKSEKYILFQKTLESEFSKDVPGILLSVKSKDIDWNGAIGVSDKESAMEINTSQTFRIASVTKTFVAASILRLWEEDKLDLEDPISKYISIEHAEKLIEGGYNPDSITIRNLLNHSSGLDEHTRSYKFQHDFLKTRHVWTRSEQVGDLIEFGQKVGEPGERFSYSDTGYILLAEILEKITGLTMGEAFNKLLDYKKLGLKNTYMESPDGDLSGNRIHQYYQGNDTYNYHPSVDYFGGGGLLSTTSDLCTFYNSLFHNQVFNKPETLEEMVKIVPSKETPEIDYGMGIWRTNINGQMAYTHSGFWGTQVIYLPDLDVAIATNYSQKWTKRGNAPIFEKIIEILKEE